MMYGLFKEIHTRGFWLDGIQLQRRSFGYIAGCPHQGLMDNLFVHVLVCACGWLGVGFGMMGRH